MAVRSVLRCTLATCSRRDAVRLISYRTEGGHDRPEIEGIGRLVNMCRFERAGVPAR